MMQTRREKRRITNLIAALMICLICAVGLFGCGKETTETSGDNVTPSVQTKPDAELTEGTDEFFDPKEGTIKLSSKELRNYATVKRCEFDIESQSIIYELEMPEIPASDDESVYLYAFECYEDINSCTESNYVGSSEKNRTMTFSIEYNRRFLFCEFVPAIIMNGERVPISDGFIMSNPDILAPNQEAYPVIESKKGLLIDPATLGKEELTELGVRHAIYNMPLSVIMGETDDPEYPTIEYEYEGITYYFNGHQIAAYDGLFSYLYQMGMNTTVIILNDWNPEHMEMIHPLSREQAEGAYYYSFNTAEEAGVREIEAIALFLAERYTSGEHGVVRDWVIANEINEHHSWNYMNTDDLDYYVKEFEKGFRIFFQAIRSRCANSKIYFSIDNQWNSRSIVKNDFFNGKDLLEKMNETIRSKGNYDWGLAIHPYPDPLTRVNFWDVQYDKSENAKTLTIMNLKTLTSVLEKEEFLDPEGRVREVAITELGFSSMSGEKLQSAAFIYCYYILNENPYVTAFIMNRQTDAREEIKDGLAFGIYKPDLTPKYLLDIYKHIDTDGAKEYMDFMLNIIGADSLEEALSWAE